MYGLQTGDHRGGSVVVSSWPLFARLFALSEDLQVDSAPVGFSKRMICNRETQRQGYAFAVQQVLGSWNPWLRPKHSQAHPARLHPPLPRNCWRRTNSIHVVEFLSNRLLPDAGQELTHPRGGNHQMKMDASSRPVLTALPAPIASAMAPPSRC